MSVYAAYPRQQAVSACVEFLSAAKRIVALTTVPASDHAAIAAEFGSAVANDVIVVDGSAIATHDAADVAVRAVRRAALDRQIAIVIHANRVEARHLWAFACATQLANGRLLTIGDGLMYRLSGDDSVFRIIHHDGPLFNAAIAPRMEG